MRHRFAFAVAAASALQCQLVAGLDAPLAAVDGGVTESGGGAAGYRAAVLADAPILYFRLGETSGSVAHDESGSGNDGVLSGNFALKATGAISGDADTALELADDSARVTVPNRFDLAGTTGYALEIWVLRNTSGPGTLFDKSAVGGNGPLGTLAFVDTVSPSNKIVIGFERWSSSGLIAYVHDMSLGLTGGVYDHVVFTSDGVSPPRMYLNDVPTDGSINPPGGGPPKVNESLVIGGGFGGSIDEVAVYTHNLAATRVHEHYRIGKTGR